MLRLIGLVIVAAWLPLGEVDGQSVTQELEYLRDQQQLPLTLPPPAYLEGAQVDAHEGDSLALVEFYKSTSGSSTWTNRTGWLEGPVSQWHGISLTNQGRVRQIYLQGNGLSGPLPADLGQLTELEILRLSGNSLTGAIPPELGNLTKLERLSLGANDLSGTIPSELGNLTKLILFGLGYNGLTGKIPSEFGLLTELEFLWLNSNDLTGTIPSELENLKKLTLLDLQDNDLSGTILSEFGLLTELEFLNLAFNDLTGTIPPELGNLKKLTSLHLSANNLSGVIPPELGNLSNLNSLGLGLNRISGAIPKELGDLRKLQTLYLHTNNFSGPIPQEFGQLSELSRLHLSGNNLSGSVHQDFAQLSNLRFLYLNQNQLSGIIPDLTSLSQLDRVRVQDNRFLFADLLPNAALDPLNEFTYAPQDSINTQLTCEGSQYVFTTPATAQGNAYKWYRDGEEIASEQTNTLRVSATDNPAVYHASITNDALPDLTLYSRKTSTSSADPCQTRQFAHEGDSLALVELYKSTKGSAWTTRTGWLQTLVSEWHGITLSSEGRVTNVALSENNLEGSLPEEIEDLDSLRVLSLADNVISGLMPDLTSLKQLGSVRVQDNRFLFKDLLPNATFNPASGFTYAPQDSINTQLTCEGSQYVFSTPATAQDNKYQWYRNGTSIPGQESPTLKVSASSTDQYHASITNDALQDLTLYSRKTSTSSIAPCQTRQFAHVGDSLVLVKLYNSTQGNGWTTKTNWLQAPVSEWFGITLSSEGRVTDIQLRGNNLTGTLPSDLGKLDSLAQLDLGFLSSGRNAISGAIPKELGQLSKLHTLVLSRNKWSDPIPPELGQLAELTELDLSYNQFAGAIPQELTRLTKLTGLYLHHNALNGEIPSVLGQMNLRELLLHGNKLTGNIPPELSQLSKLEDLRLYDNQLTGEIPPELGDLSELKNLRLNENDLSGSIPPELGNLSQLQTLNLRSNDLSGALPKELGQLSNLENLWLYDNHLSGSIPPELGNLSQLRILHLHINDLSGALPKELGQLSNLEYLNLYDNRLSGALPKELGELAALNDLRLNNNNFSGPVPDLTGLNQLNSVRVQDNQFLFADLLPNKALSSLEEFTYAPQDSIDTQLKCEAAQYVFTTPATAQGNAYKWYRDGEQIANEQTNTLRVSATDNPAVYHASITNSELQDLTLYSRKTSTSSADPCQTRQFAHEGDSLALVELYKSTKGSAWTTRTGWLQTLVSEWHGITLSSEGRVTNVALSENNLEGPLPEEIEDLDSLRVLSLADNVISGLMPDLTSLKQLGSVRVQDNRFLFKDLLPNATFNPASGFTYAPQDSINTQLTCEGSQYVFSTPATAQDNKYRWYRNDEEIATEQSNTLRVNASSTDQYHASITNNKLQDLTLYSRKTSTSSITPCQTGQFAHAGDSLALVKLYNSTQGNGWTTKTGWLQTPVSEWFGITLSSRGRVTDIQLRGNNLTGTLPSDLGKLDSLAQLDLGFLSSGRNAISGAIPKELGQLSKLHTLVLSRNKFSDPIPPELGQLTALKELVLAENELTGTIPPELGQLSELRQLRLSLNKLSGSIPPQLGNLAKLTLLWLPGNELTGTIPRELGQLSELNQLNLSDNSLSGAIPKELGQLTKLFDLNLTDNNLSGAIPKELGQLSRLDRLDLGQNQLGGSIPRELGQLSELFGLNLSGNNLSGTIPPELGQLVKLNELDLHENDLSGPTPRELGQLSQLNWLDLSDNTLSGSVPQELAQISTLEYLYLNQNQFSGLVPNLTGLSLLDRVRLQDNRFLFADLLPNAALNPASGFTYAPQDSINTQLTCEGSEYVFTTPATAQGNKFKWYRDGEEIANVQTNTLRVSATDNPAVYHASITNDALPDLTLYSRKTSTSSADPCQTRQFTHEGDSLALVELYKSTKGSAWTTRTGWLQTPVSEWHGITLSSEGRVTNVALSENNLEGSLPEEIEDLDSLRVLALADNVISGLMPNLTSLKQLGSVRVQDNRFLFKDLLPNATLNPASGFTYAPQDSINTQLTCEGSEYVFSTPATAQGNAYKWYRNGEEIGNEQTNTLRVSASSTGQYHASVTNNALSDLTLYSRKTSTSSSAPCQNSAPTIANAIADQTIAVGDTYSVDLTTVFSDPDNDVLTFAAISGDIATATAAISNNTLTVTGVAVGSATITVSATDTQGSNTKVEDSFTVTVTNTARQFAHEGDSLVLVELYNSTEGNTWTRNTGWLQTPVSEWFGITLDADGRVTGVDLQSNNLVGQLPKSIGTLAKLDSLSLPENELTGPIPPELGQLKELSFMWLSWNDLYGEIPVELAQMTQMEELHFTENSLTGQIPKELGQMANLKYLWLTGNSLSGTIPSELRHLKKIGVNANNLSGPIPTHLGEWANLIELHLCDNNFTGPIPAQLGQLSELEFLCLRNNQLSGSIPTELNQLSRLKTLWLHENHLSGPVPDLTSLSQLNSVRINTNQFLFADLLPNAALSRLREFTYAPQDTIETQLTCRASEYVLTTPATAEDNRYQWYRDDQALNGARSDTLRISVMDSPADYHATIKHDLLPDLTLISRKANTRDASACTRIAHVADSTLLVDFYNRTHGSLLWHDHTGWLEDPVAQWYGITLDASGRVTDIDLPYNNLVGQLPLSRLDQLAHLRYLNVSGNQFSGTIPEELGDLTQLEYLMLSNNKLAGTIPRELADQAPLKVLDISGNQLAGEIPTELNQITTLQSLSVSANQLSGPVPDFTGLNQLDSLHVAQNEFFFMDLLPNASLTRLDDFVYAPQDSIDTFLSRTASGFAFTTAAKAMGNRYQWYRDDQPISGPQSDTLHVSLYADPAQYHATITNDRLPALTLVSRKKGVHDRVTMTEAEFTEDILLHQSYPNPFAEATTVAFELGAPEYVRIVVYDLLGQVVAKIADGRFAAGVHRIEFTGDHLASGQYLYRMEAGAYQATRFMSVVR